MGKHSSELPFRSGDALVAVDVQNDFLPGGSLAVPRGDEVVPILNRYLTAFRGKNLPVFATRDWHPPNHCSFKSQGGAWPVHCVAGTHGAEFSSALKLASSAVIISKATKPGQEAYSGFEGTELLDRLRQTGVKRLFVGGLATDYCVLNTVLDALKHGFEVRLLRDAVRAVNLRADDGRQAEEQMLRCGAVPFALQE